MSLSTLNEQLLAGVRARNKTAITEVYREYFKPCAKVVLKDGGMVDDAREVFQQVMFSLMEKLETPDFTIKSNLKGYLYQSCFNQWVQNKRKQRRYDSIDDDGKLTVIPDNSNDTIAEKEEQEIQYEAMYACIKKMNTGCRKGLELFYFENKRDKEIAVLMSFTVDYVKQQRRRCMKSLRKCMVA